MKLFSDAGNHNSSNLAGLIAEHLYPVSSGVLVMFIIPFIIVIKNTQMPMNKSNERCAKPVCRYLQYKNYGEKWKRWVNKWLDIFLSWKTHCKYISYILKITNAKQSQSRDIFYISMSAVCMFCFMLKIAQKGNKT